jgi:hypothetical protein
MTSTDTTTTAASTSSTNIVTEIQNALEADFQKVVTFFQGITQKEIAFLTALAQGVEVGIADIQAIAQGALSKLGIAGTIVNEATTAAAIIAPGNASVTKVLSDISTGITDATALATAVSTNTAPAGSGTVVTDAVNVLNAANTLSQLASQVSATLGQLAQQSPTAAQVTSPPTPNEG